jgi:hypothetical protein
MYVHGLTPDHENERQGTGTQCTGPGGDDVCVIHVYAFLVGLTARESAPVVVCAVNS